MSIVSHATALDQAVAAFRTKKQALMARPFADETRQHTELDALLADLRPAVDDAIAAADAEGSSAQTALDTMEGLDPMFTLRGDDLTRAHQLRDSVRDSFEALPLETLARRVQHAVASKDPAERVLTAQYGRARLDRAISEGQDMATTNARDLMSGASSRGDQVNGAQQGLTDFRRAVGALELALSDQPKRTAIVDRIKAAQELRARAQRALAEADWRDQAARNALATSVARSF